MHKNRNERSIRWGMRLDKSIEMVMTSELDAHPSNSIDDIIFDDFVILPNSKSCQTPANKDLFWICINKIFEIQARKSEIQDLLSATNQIKH